MDEFDLAWFFTTFVGGQWDGIVTDPQYDMALSMATLELSNVKCYCPDQYPIALAIKIHLILTQLGSFDGTPGLAPANDTGKVAFVVRDKVYDSERQYTLVDQNQQVIASTPTGMLERLIEFCRPRLKIGATLVRSNVGRCGTCSWTLIGDKADG